MTNKQNSSKMKNENRPTNLPNGIGLIDPLKASLLQLDYTSPRTLLMSINRANNGPRGEGGLAGFSWDPEHLGTNYDLASAPRMTYHLDEQHAAALYGWHVLQVAEVSPLTQDEWNEQVDELTADLEALGTVEGMFSRAIVKLDQFSSLLTKAMQGRLEYQRRGLQQGSKLAIMATRKLHQGGVLSQAEAAKLMDVLGRCKGASDIGHGLSRDRSRGLENMQAAVWGFEHGERAGNYLRAINVQESRTDRRAACLDEARADIESAAGDAYGHPARVWLNEMANLLDLEARHYRGEVPEDKARAAEARREFIMAGLDALLQFDSSQEVASKWESNYLNAVAVLDTTDAEWPAPWAIAEATETPEPVAA